MHVYTSYRDGLFVLAAAYVHPSTESAMCSSFGKFTLAVAASRFWCSELGIPGVSHSAAASLSAPELGDSVTRLTAPLLSLGCLAGLLQQVLVLAVAALRSELGIPGVSHSVAASLSAPELGDSVARF